MLPFLAPESGSDVNESPIHRNDDIVRFLIDGKMVTSEEAESAYPLDEKSQKNEAQRLKNMKEVRTLESDIAFHIQRSGDQPVEVGEAGKISPAMAVAMRLAGEMCDLVDLVDPKNTESYGTIYAGSDYGIVSPEYVNMLSNDPNKLWESSTPEQFKENGKYNQISLSDSGELFISIIKPGAVESIPLQVDPEFVEPIREYLKKIRSTGTVQMKAGKMDIIISVAFTNFSELFLCSGQQKYG